MTNLEYFRQMDEVTLANYLVHTEEIYDGDYDDDDQWIPFLNTYYVTPAAPRQIFAHWDDAMKETIEWLKEEHDEVCS